MTHSFDVNRFIEFLPNFVIASFVLITCIAILISQKIEEWKEKRERITEIKREEEKFLARRQYRKDKLFNDVKESYRLGYKGLHHREWREAKTDEERDAMMRKYSDEMFEKYFK